MLAALRAIAALAGKDLRLLSRDRAAVFLTFGWPLVLASFFGALGPGFGAALESSGESSGEGSGGGSGGAMVVLAIDEDRSPASAALLEALDAHPRVTLEASGQAAAREQVRQGDRPAFIHLPPGFSERPRVTLGVDPRRASEAELLESALELAAYQAQSSDPRAVIDIARQSITAQGGRAQARPPSPYAVTFPQGIIWAVLACAATFAVSLVNERSRGTLMRLAVAPLPRWQILAGKGAACLAAIVIMELVLIAIAVLGFGVRPQSWPLLVLALLSTGLAFVGVMALLAALGRKTSSAAGLSWAILMGLAMLGGGMLPLFMMPPWLQTAAWVSPVAWSLRAIEGAVWRGSSAAEIGLASLALLGLGALGMAFGARIVRDL